MDPPDDPAFARTLGRAAAAARKTARLSQTEAAALVGISRNYLSGIERGTPTVAAWIVGRLAHVYGVPVGTFYGEPVVPAVYQTRHLADLLEATARELRAAVEDGAG